mgnify:CR=1 FL=1
MIIQDIEKFIPYNEQEEKDKEEILRRLKNNEKLLTRDNKSAHLTASAWVLNQDHNKVLMAIIIFMIPGHGLEDMLMVKVIY